MNYYEECLDITDTIISELYKLQELDNSKKVRQIVDLVDALNWDYVQKSEQQLARERLTERD